MRVDVSTSTESILTTLQAYKSLTASYAQRVRHAEQIATDLMASHLTREEFLSKVVNRVTQHMTERGADEASQYLLIIKAALLSLQEIQKRNPDQSLVETIKALSLATGKK